LANNLVARYDLGNIYTEQTPLGFKPERVSGLAYNELGLLKIKKGFADDASRFFS